MDLTPKESPNSELLSLIIWVALFLFYGGSKNANRWENLLGFFILVVMFCAIITLISHQISDEFTIENEKGVPTLKDEYFKMYLSACYRIGKIALMEKIHRDKDIQNNLISIAMLIFCFAG